ncbi:MAG: CDP-alcohol phosphatidyltransferase family protein [Clostridiales bacterium]|jgi:cardiolipin synthase|nr:CDP-alcohol phosphatidyltransferase family protein [Clostridiales bacterium]
MNIPNVLTVIRFLLVPAFVYAYLFSGSMTAAVVILAVSGLTDVLDGYIARKYHMITKWGTVFDPIADKLTQITTAFCIAYGGVNVMWFAFALLLAKELVMVLGGIKLYKKGDVVVSANWYGKAATLLFYLVFFALMLFRDTMSDYAQGFLIIAASALSVFALARYVVIFLGMRKKLF